MAEKLYLDLCLTFKILSKEKKKNSKKCWYFMNLLIIILFIFAKLYIQGKNKNCL